MSSQLSGIPSSSRQDAHFGFPSTQKLEMALRKASKKAVEYEGQMRDVEATLSHHLAEFRTFDSDVQQTMHTLRVNSNRVDRASNVQVPRIEEELDESMETLVKLGAELPVIQSQVNCIADVYLSGHETARILVSELDWLNTDFYERWRRIIFTSTSPVSWRWKAIMRTLFILSFMACFWLLWIAVAGAYRAHRHRLVWGDKLMS
ncbi:hypothetical protein AGABI1DRAFT_112002 [Agaricus bisporus var. burnettii JB137-S8]|uniref:Uncharacterized protein n=1 Tax=Agaricus bisporus var. burnettii (strain JB137-S8 / ATCC MYA-4627 / FGSC 10392) TaxID=597362 RepID=K5W4M2_AGABU|nr:uncharacterized protein AGABI1DRAFT_112002 [Agaricus bisporus var. burnettii JB137-S8]EKM81749.1 hypothetical protein AGABI1DRAFT_112002 [Agaricus bisporus var. burnettii JB137-S8]